MADVSLFDDGASDADPGQPGASARGERPGGWVVGAVVVAVLALIVGGYVASHYVAGDKVPRGTVVSGVDIGGMSRAEARDALEAAFADRASEPIEVTVDGDRTDQVTPEQVGLAVDVDATLDEAGATASWSPSRLWEFYAGGDEIDAVVSFDDGLLAAELAELSQGLGTPPEDGQVRFTRTGEIRTVAPETGKAIDPEVARRVLTEAYLGDDESAELSVVDAAPEIDEDDVSTAVTTLAEPAVSAPVTLVFGESEVTLEPRRFARTLRLVPQDGELALHVRQKALNKLVKGATSQGKPVDATVRLVRGQPKVVPAKPGVAFQPADVSAVFADLVRASGDERTGEVEAKVEEADFTTKDAEELQIKELVSEFSTFYPHADYRNVNIGRAAEIIDGTVLKPGETFSMNGIVGERTAENGFTHGYIIDGGVLRQDYGGGVSQMATTLFNAMFFAGLKDVEHKPHSFYIDRYPVGREATVAWPTVDLRFQNDTEHGVLVHAWVEPSNYSRQGKVTVQMFSTKVWDIESQTSERYGYVSPGTRHLQTPDCEPHTGWSGFQVDVTRIFREHGESAVDHTEEFHTNYTPSDTVVCGPPPGASPPPGGGGDGDD
jgi:vancomycin resistance protein YoaR